MRRWHRKVIVNGRRNHEQAPAFRGEKSRARGRAVTTTGRTSLDSEYFRSVPRTCPPLRETLTTRQADRTRYGLLVSGVGIRRGSKPHVDMRRRAFITLIGGVATAWPLAARAQQPERMRRIGVLMSAVEGDQRGLEYVTAFAQGLAELGWTVGRNVRIEYRWGAGDLDRFRRYAAYSRSRSAPARRASGEDAPAT
jgi:hypothetical protein